MSSIEKRGMAYINDVSIDLLETLKDLSNNVKLGFGKNKKQLLAKGYIDDNYDITKKGIELLKKYDENQVIKINKVQKLNSKEFYVDLHNKLKDKIKQLTGKPNKKMEINGKPTSYSFLCTPKDLHERMQTLLKKYPDIDDPDIVEHVLLEHCQHNSPIIEYYILKTEHGITKSRLYTDYCSTDKENLSTKKQINLTIYNK
jgi:hypothetical protein